MLTKGTLSKESLGKRKTPSKGVGGKKNSGQRERTAGLQGKLRKDQEKKKVREMRKRELATEPI